MTRISSIFSVSDYQDGRRSLSPLSANSGDTNSAEHSPRMFRLLKFSYRSAPRAVAHKSGNFKSWACIPALLTGVPNCGIIHGSGGVVGFEGRCWASSFWKSACKIGKHSDPGDRLRGRFDVIVNPSNSRGMSSGFNYGARYARLDPRGVSKRASPRPSSNSRCKVNPLFNV